MRRIQYFITLATGDDRIRVDFETDQGEVTALHAVQYETRVEDTWRPVARYDTAHGFFHMDAYTNRGSMKYRVEVVDLGAALTFAVNDLKSQWRLYKQHFLRGLR
jgi:hypothetical protein